MLIDLASTKFWLLVLCGLLVLTPVVHVTARRLILCAVNLTFLGMLLHRQLAGVLAALAVFYVLLRAMQHPGPRRAAVAIVLGGALWLFVLHKLPYLANPLHAGSLLPILTAVGYSYVLLRAIDLARVTWEGRTLAPDPVNLVNYLLPFHMLAAGPIQSWDDFIDQPKVPDPLNFNQALGLIERIVHGLFKKYVLAMAVSSIFLTQGRAGGWYRLVEMNMTYLWLYLDFSAYSDIAVGIGGLLGIATPENFRRPYVARNITDFWERWHISLSLWIRRNLFFPIQMNLVRQTNGRYSLWCASIAIFISFLLCGWWHGLTLPFLAWGVANGAGLVVVNLYRYWLKKRLGPKGVARYLASWPIRAAAVVLTFEFVAFTILLIATRWGGTS